MVLSFNLTLMASVRYIFAVLITITRRYGVISLLFDIIFSGGYNYFR